MTKKIKKAPRKRIRYCANLNCRKVSDYFGKNIETKKPIKIEKGEEAYMKGKIICRRCYQRRKWLIMRFSK